MSDHYKHISEGAARKAADELARVKAEQRAAARTKLEEQAKVAGPILDLTENRSAENQSVTIN
jgi:hypothetical protein